MDQDGCVVCSADGESKHIPTTRREVYDITGAGDMFLAMLGFCWANRIPLQQAASLANFAAGLEVARLGASPISRQELLHALQLLYCDPSNQADRLEGKVVANASKLITQNEATRLAEKYRRNGFRIVFTNGCFDLLHAGHVRCLQDAAALGDVLFVAINSDASVRRIKGPSRPVYSEEDRVALLAALSCVDHVLILDQDTPHQLLHCIRPDVLVKGGTTQEVACRHIVEAWGGQVHVTPAVPNLSTSATIQQIHAAESLHVAAHDH